MRMSRGSYIVLNSTCVYVCTVGCGLWVDELLYSYIALIVVCVCVCVCVCVRAFVHVVYISLTSYLHRTLNTYM